MAKNKKRGASFDETPPENMLIKAYWLVALDIHRTVVAGLDDGVSEANVEATQVRVLYRDPRDTNRPASLL